MNTLDFDILDFSREVKRNQVLPYMFVNCVNQMHLEEFLQKDQLGSFLKQITTKVYRQDVQYHNDLHGADVMQMAYFMLTTG